MNESYPNIQDGIPAADAALPDEHDRLKWFVMRDLKRCNARLPAYRLFKELGIEAFTPMVWKLSVRHGKRCREKVPFMQDLLFVHDTRHSIDSVVESYNTIQYRYVRGGYRIPMTVRDADMQRFIHAVESSESPRYYTPDEISSDMIGRKGLRMTPQPAGTGRPSGATSLKRSMRQQGRSTSPHRSADESAFTKTCIPSRKTLMKTAMPAWAST